MPTDTSSRCLWCGVAAGRAWYRTDVPCVVACERCPVVVTGDQAPGLAERPGAVDPEEADGEGERRGGPEQERKRMGQLSAQQDGLTTDLVALQAGDDERQIGFDR